MLATEAYPFIKFAGGKRAIIKELLTRIPKDINNYYEPFVGGGALFFALNRVSISYISDTNGEIINCYKVIKHQPKGLISMLNSFPYDREGDMQFNKKFFLTLRAMDREEGWEYVPEVYKAARTIYLNRTCYNGLYRVNSRGEFNTPFGKYKNPKIVDVENIMACSKALQNVVIQHVDFQKAIESVESGDFVYFDPPYIPLSSTANFTSYNKDGFSMEDHEDLLAVCQSLDRSGVKFMLTNSNTDVSKKLYKGFHIEEVKAPRSINRESSSDIIVRNY